MQPSFEKLIPAPGESFRCFNRHTLATPVKWHRHPEIELTYVEHGAGSRLVGDHIGSYSDGDLVLLGSDLPHTWLSDEYRGQREDRHPAVVVQFHPAFLGDSFFAAGELDEIRTMLKRAERGLWFRGEAAERIGATMTRMVEMSGASRLLALLNILHELAGSPATILASASSSARSSATAETRIRMVCDHIADHLTDPALGHAQLAELAHMNPSAFSRFFRQSTGRTVSSWITELRIGLACRLLADTDLSILEISVESGFSNLSNFNRRFRQLREMTPREYRARCRHAA